MGIACLICNFRCSSICTLEDARTRICHHLCISCVIRIAVQAPANIPTILGLSEAPMLCFLTVSNAMLQSLERTAARRRHMLTDAAVRQLDIWTSGHG